MNQSMDFVPDTSPSSPKLVRSKNKEQTLWLYRMMITWRFLLAMFGGYIIAKSSAILIAEYFKEAESAAAMSATLIAFLLQACAFIWVFMVNKTTKASIGIIVPAVVLYVLTRIVGAS